MIRGVYIILGQIAYYGCLPALFVISLFARPRVRVIILNDKNQVLLVRNWFGRQRWALPGGGRHFREPPVRAAQRELREELSFDLPIAQFRPLGMLARYDAATPFSADVFFTEVPADIMIYRQPLELIDHMWVSLNQLPATAHPSVGRSLGLWQKQR